MLVKANKNSEAGAPPSPELIAAITKLADEGADGRGVMVGAGGFCPVRRECALARRVGKPPSLTAPLRKQRN